MVAVVKGERSQPSPRARTAPSATRTPARGRAAARDAKPARPEKSDRAGLGPRLALIVGALVILGGAFAGVLLARHDRALQPHPAATAEPLAVHVSPLAGMMARIGFRLERVEVQGAPDMAKADILRAVTLAKDTPILALGLDDLRRRVEATGWVKDAKIVRLLPDTLVIAVTPRTPAAVWQHLGVSKVVDLDGQLIGGADPARFPELPLVVGDGAAEEAKAILPQLRQRPGLMAKVDALVLVDGRRWDLRLKDGSLIQLPAIGSDSALIQLDQLDQKQRILSLGFERVDLRNPEMVVVRPKPAASLVGAGQAAPAVAGPVKN
jgi:cell division protein FtsQ